MTMASGLYTEKTAATAMEILLHRNDELKAHIAKLEKRNDMLERVGVASERYFTDITAACWPELELALLAAGYLKKHKQGGR